MPATRISADTPVICPAIVGRDLQLASLTRGIEQTREGHGRLTLVAGSAGVGKTRLVAEARTRAARTGLKVLEGRCFEQDSSLPYAPVLDLLRSFAAAVPTEEFVSALGFAGREIVKLVPELQGVAPTLVPTPPLAAEAEKRRLFQALATFLNQLALAQPCLVIIEDLHWSDSTSLDWLLFLARRIEAQPIFLLLTYRQDEITRDLSHLLAELDRERLATELRLGRLSTDEVDAMLRAIFELRRPVHAEFLGTIYALTEGNPFFVEEILKALVTAGELYAEDGILRSKPTDDLHIPRSVQDAVRRRSEQLGETARQTLTLASVVGRRFDFALLESLMGMDESTLLQSIKELVAAQLVVEESPDQFAFRHALTREAAYSTVLLRERTRYHRMIADALERHFAGDLGGHVGELAYHSYEAGQWERAASYSRLAGEDASRLYAPREAIIHFTRALEATRQTPAPLPVDLLRARGRAYEIVGEFDSARADFDQALTISRRTHNAQSEWKTLQDLGMLWASKDYAKAGEILNRGLELAGTLGDAKLRGHSLNRVGNWYVNLEQPDEGLRYHREALGVFQDLNDRPGLVETLDLLGMASQLNSDLIQAHAFYRRAIDLVTELNDRQGLVSTLASLSLSTQNYLKSADVPAIRLSEAIDAGLQAVKIAREIGWRAGEAYGWIMLALCLGPQGEYGRALEAAHTALANAEEIKHRQWMAGAHVALGILYRDVLAFGLARTHLEQALALGHEVGSRIWTDSAASYLATVLIAQGEFERAESVLNEAQSSPELLQTQGQRLCGCTSAELALARGQAKIALQIADRLIETAANAKPETIIPRIHKLRGQALAALGETRQAERALSAVRDAAEQQELRPLLWQVDAALGKLHRAHGRREHAEEDFGAARALVHALAANVPDESLRHSFLARALAELPPEPVVSAARAEKAKYGGLTARERQVAALVAQGQSNHAIAAELVVGERTVEAHITHILNKLGFSARAQIAAWAVEKGLARAARDRVT